MIDFCPDLELASVLFYNPILDIRPHGICDVVEQDITIFNGPNANRRLYYEYVLDKIDLLRYKLQDASNIYYRFPEQYSISGYNKRRNNFLYIIKRITIDD